MTNFKINKIELWKLVFIPILFLYIYVPTFYGIGGLTKIYLLFAGFYFLFNYKKLIKFFLNSYIFFMAFFMVVIVLITRLIPLIFETYDFSFNNYFLVSLAINLPLTFLILSFFDKKINFKFEDILNAFFIIGIIQAIFILMDWFIPSFRNFLQAILVIDFDIETSIRATGLSYGTGDALSFIQAFSFLCGLYIIYYKKQYFINIVFLALIFISIMFIGRTGIVIAIIGTILYSLSLIKDNFFLIIKFFLISLFLLIIFVFIGFQISDERFLRIINWAFEFYFSFANDGTFETSTTNILRDMYFLPTKELTILFGEGHYLHPYDKDINYIPSDSGYIRTIFFGGFFTLILLILFYLYILFIFKKFLTNKEFIFIFVFFILLFIIQYKIPILYYGTTMRMIFVLLIISYFIKYKNLEYEKE
ncbi:hypothetical protein ACN091_08535 [Aliarcobacter butzleri]|uniref:hypothetical protein n=1 Tax=Aliarcobacter butzleri TaxID=28197 RepID=UPI003AD981DA